MVIRHDNIKDTLGVHGTSFEDIYPELCDQLRRSFRDYIHKVNGQMAAHNNSDQSIGNIAVTVKGYSLPQISNTPADLKTVSRDRLVDVYKDYINCNYRKSRQSQKSLLID